MASVVLNAKEFGAGLDLHFKTFERRWALRLLAAQEWAMMSLQELTPVWSGQASASYMASIGAPRIGFHGGFEGEDGTNRMPLGPERNRSVAESVSWRTLPNKAPKSPWTSYWITNAAPHISGLEHGELPNGPNMIPRSAGMFFITAARLAAMFKARQL